VDAQRTIDRAEHELRAFRQEHTGVSEQMKACCAWNRASPGTARKWSNAMESIPRGNGDFSVDDLDGPR
jgi:hypothetical protein